MRSRNVDFYLHTAAQERRASMTYSNGDLSHGSDYLKPRPGQVAKFLKVCPPRSRMARAG